jgi:ankyrin repeat protein
MEVFPIHDAARRGNLERVRQLIYDDDGNVRWDAHEDDEDGAIPLHYAAKYNHVEVARLLLDAGSNVNEIEELGTTPLQYAASTGSVEMTMLLLERGADQSVGDSALDEAIRTGHHAVAEILSRWNNVSV